MRGTGWGPGEDCGMAAFTASAFWKWLADIGKQYGFAGIVAVCLAMWVNNWMWWGAENIARPLVIEHREFLKSTGKAVEAGAESQRRTAEAVGEIRKALDEMRRVESRRNDVGRTTTFRSPDDPGG